MSETELATGKAAAEEMQGWKPLPEPAPEETKTYSGDEGLHEAARDLATVRDASPVEPIVRTYAWTGDNEGGSVGSRESVTLERAAHDLSEAHRQEADAQFQAAGANLAAEVDRVRAWAAGTPDPQQETQQSSEIPQAQSDELSQPPANGLSPKVAAALQDPEIRQAIESAIAPAEQARQQYLAGLTQAAEFATAGVLAKLQAKYPNITQEQIPAALQLLETQDPALRAELKADANRAVALLQQHQQVQGQLEHAKQAQHREYAKSQDEAFDKSVANESPEVVRAAAREIIDFAESHGIPKETMAQIWESDPVVRSSVFQRLMFDAAKYRLAQKSATANPASRSSIPPVQRPGVAQPRSGYRDGEIAALRAELKNSTGMAAVRAAARLHSAQRRARG